MKFSELRGAVHSKDCLKKLIEKEEVTMRKSIYGLLTGLILASFLVVSVSEVFAKDEVYDVVWPRGRAVSKIIPLAKRLDTLEGKTVCELWDYMFRGDEIFPMLEKLLLEKYPGIKFVHYKEFGRTHGADEAKVLAAFGEKFKKFGCDAAISAVGC